ncbi:MAG: GNAT family N-acetyltransferase, partial [Chloroflexi bacterium]|nr:GNAT family N-acetyltransferase [Chloroflexota bacterium]
MMQTIHNTVAVNIPSAPIIPGLTFRAFRGESDFPHMVAVIEGSKKHDQGERVITAENLANHFKHLDNCDPYQDMLFAEIDGQVIGYSRVQWEKESNGSYHYRAWGIILPAWRVQGIGSAMLKYNENHLREIAQQH